MAARLTDRILTTKVRELGSGTQTVYVYSNTSVPGRVKIGHTTSTDYLKRIREQLNAGKPGQVQVEIAYRTNDSASLERALHAQLLSKRVRGTNEWFAVTVDWLLANVSTLITAQAEKDAADAADRNRLAEEKSANEKRKAEEALAQITTSRRRSEVEQNIKNLWYASDASGWRMNIFARLIGARRCAISANKLACKFVASELKYQEECNFLRDVRKLNLDLFRNGDHKSLTSSAPTGLYIVEHHTEKTRYGSRSHGTVTIPDKTKFYLVVDECGAAGMIGNANMEEAREQLLNWSRRPLQDWHAFSCVDWADCYLNNSYRYCVHNKITYRQA